MTVALTREEQLVEALRDLEWAGNIQGDDACLFCHNFKDGHREYKDWNGTVVSAQAALTHEPDCEWAKLVKP